MKQIKILLALAVIALAGCQAQQGPATTLPGLPPQAIVDLVAVETNSTNDVLAPLTNDIDVSGTGLTITAVAVDLTVPPLGTPTASTDGQTVTFTPPANFVGVVTLHYSIVDGTGATSSSAIVVSVLPIASLPLAVPDAATVTQDSAATDVDVLANDLDPAGGGLTLTGATVTASVPSATHTVAIVGNKVRFTPAAGFAGLVVVTYTATDVNGSSELGVLSLVVSPLDLTLGPIPVPDAAVVAQNSGATSVDVLANDVDPAAGGLTLSGVTVTASVPNAAHAVSVSGNQVQFTPAAGFVGVVVVGYTATDVNGNSANGVLNVVVSPLSLALGPVPVPDVATVAQDSGATDIDVAANDIDPAAGGLTLTGVTVTASVPTAAHTVAIAGNKVRFTPAAGFAGAVVVSYTVTDVNGSSANGLLSVVVSPVNLALGPVPVPDVATVAQDSGATDVDVVANDVDPAAGGLTLTAASVTASVPSATHTVAIVGNKVRFTPAAGFAGVAVVTYTVTDVNGNSASSVLSIVVSPLGLAVGPVPVPDAATVAQDSGATDIDVVANDVDPAAGGLTLTAVSVTASVPSAAHTVAIAGNKVRFTPAAGFAGAVVVSYTVTDVNGNSASSVLSIVVSPLSLAAGPVPVPDAATVAQDSGATSIDVVANDVDPAGGGLTLTGASVATSVPSATHTVAVAGNQVQFTPAAGFAGVVVVSYTVTDVNGASANGVLSIVVSPLSLAAGPVPVPDAATVTQDSGATSIDVVANDVDPAGGGLTLTAASVTGSVPAGTHTVAIVGNQVQFTPGAGFVGAVVVSYTVTDVNGASANGLLNVVVSPVSLAVGPVPVPDAAVVAQDSGATSVDVLANDVDPAAGGLTLTAVSVTSSVPSATHTVAISGNQVQFTPAAGFTGAVVVTYTETDVNGNTADGVLSIVVSPLSLALGPVPVPDAATVAQDSGATNVNVLANDVDPAGGGLTLTAVSVTASVPTATHTVAISANQVQFTPAAGFAGTVVVTYTETDVNGNSANGVLNVVVSPTALTLGPVAIPDVATVAQDSGATSIDVIANDVDPAGGGLTVSAVSVTSSLPSATHTVAISGNQVQFTPAAGFAGVVVVSYTITDANGQTSNGVLDITVTPTALQLGPVAAPDTGLATSSGGAQLFDVLANDIDPAGGGLTLTGVSITLAVPAGAGSVAIVANKVQYTPTALYLGSVLITYTATDINGNTTTGQLSLTVTL